MIALRAEVQLRWCCGLRHAALVMVSHTFGEVEWVRHYKHARKFLNAELILSTVPALGTLRPSSMLSSVALRIPAAVANFALLMPNLVRCLRMCFITGCNIHRTVPYRQIFYQIYFCNIVSKINYCNCLHIIVMGCNIVIQNN